jgi:enoyl-CoA hydratase
LIGYARAKEYLLTGDLIPASEAARIGLINHAVPVNDLDAKVQEFADRLAAGATKSISWTKVSVNIGLKQLVQSVMETSLAYEAMSSRTADHQEAINAFRDKRAAQFNG